jgi:hypothetical protein
MGLAESKDVNQAMELQSQHVRKQMETFVHQLEEMRDLTAQIIQEASPATRTDVGTAISTIGPSNAPQRFLGKRGRLVLLRAVEQFHARRKPQPRLLERRFSALESPLPGLPAFAEAKLPPEGLQHCQAASRRQDRAIHSICVRLAETSRHGYPDQVQA